MVLKVTIDLLNDNVGINNGFEVLVWPEPTIAGYEAMHMIKKGQIRQIAKGNIVVQNTFIASLFQAVA
jgi:hypothetical protein